MMFENTTPIRMEWFYYIEGNRSKLNWFLFSFAAEYYGAAINSSEMADYRSRYGERYIAQYCAYFARRLKESLLSDLRGRTKSVIFHERFIGDFFPHHSSDLNHALNLQAMASFEALQTRCDGCPQRCLTDYKAVSAFFDGYEG